MSRNAGPSSSARKPPWAHLRDLSRTSLDKLALESPRSPDTVSSNSTVRADTKDDIQASLRRRCTVTVNESFARDDVLLNLDLFSRSFRPGMLVSIDILKPEVSKASSAVAKRIASQDAGKSASADSSQPSKRYIFVVKDMPKELKARFPHVEIYLAKNIADVFGMKKGSQVVLAPVCLRPTAHVELLSHIC